MADRVQVTVRYEEGVFHTAVDPDERADQLLLRSLYHFGIDPEDKGSWRLEAAGPERGEDARIHLDDPIGDQVPESGELRLESDLPGNREPSTGNY